MSTPPVIPASIAPAPADLAKRLQEGARELEAQFLGKEEVIRLLFISVLAGDGTLRWAVSIPSHDGGVYFWWS